MINPADMNKEGMLGELYRTEYRKIVAVLCKYFGFDQMEIAEDLAGDTFLSATETWSESGMPPNPTAWLYMVAKNKAKNYVKRTNIFDAKMAPELKKEGGAAQAGDGRDVGDEIDLSPQNIYDSQLQMMFAICHPAIPAEAQVGLALRILCGFGIEEIADAFLSNKDTINKRLFRAKEKIREAGIRIELPGPAAIAARLDNVLTTIYLLFNEGYYSGSQNRALRKELCFEAMRLCYMLIETASTNSPAANALLSLMCFHASRFEARLDENGELVLYEQQDTGLWNTDLISKGGYFLHRAATGDRVSTYHLEAGIAYWNTQRDDTVEKWEQMLRLYDLLLELDYSPMAALNRTYALSRLRGKEVAIREAEQLGAEEGRGFGENRFYFALLGELYAGIDNAKSREYFLRAMWMSRTPVERTAFGKKLPPPIE